jgi:hypothetical protein
MLASLFIAAQSAQRHERLLSQWVLVLPVFRRGFRGLTIRHHQIEKALGARR